MKNTLERHYGQRAQGQLRTLFHTARLNAVHQGTTVTLCPLANDNDCTNDWTLPVSVFLDPNNARALASAARLIHTEPPIAHGLIRASSAGVSERRYFQYNPDGTVKGTIGHLIWCPESGNEHNAVQMLLNFGGRIRWADDADDDGIVEMTDGTAVSC